ncbi:MAG TPA: TIGR00300 family protein [Vicinamibacterales bacterium]|nr:TIGR00300 family protein [Vicinamibacterales bacterium]
MESSEIVEASGHIIDSGILNSIFDTVIRHGGAFEVLQFRIGRTNDEPSLLTLRVSAPAPGRLHDLLHDLVPLGCEVAKPEDAVTRRADDDACAPVDFYSSTNHQTHVRIGGAWVAVEHQRMDAAVVVENGRVSCRKLRDLRRGDAVVCGVDGIRVIPQFQDRDRLGFAFMTNEVSSERRVELAVARVAEMMHAARAAGRPIACVAGPVVVHTGGAPHLVRLIRAGYVQVLLSGNALAVHDIEGALFNTSLGVNVETGRVAEGGHHHHMRAINAIRRAGGIRQAIDQGVLRSGIMYECVRHGVPAVLAGSIRDDGPLPETIMDLIQAQDQYAAALAGVSVVLILASMLHGIGVGNMLPSSVRTVCVDINPAVVTKLADRGSSQAIGIVTDTGLFLHQLADHLSGLERNTI